MSAPTDAAHVRVVRGVPDEQELAALVAGLVAAASSHGHEASPAPWTDRRRVLARPAARPSPPPPGPDAWRWSLHP